MTKKKDLDQAVGHIKNIVTSISFMIVLLFSVGCSQNLYGSGETAVEEFENIADEDSELAGQAVANCKIYSVSNCVSNDEGAKFVYDYKGISKK